MNNDSQSSASVTILGEVARNLPHLLVGASFGLALVSLVYSVTGSATLPQWLVPIAGMFGGESFGIMYGLYRDVSEGRQVDSKTIVQAVERAIPASTVEQLLAGNEKLLQNLEWQQSWMAQVKVLLDRDYRLGEQIVVQTREYGIQFEGFQQSLDLIKGQVEQLDARVATHADAEEIKQLIRQTQLTPRPPPLTWQFLINTDREQLTQVLSSNHLVMTGGHEGRLLLLTNSGLRHLAGDLALDGPANSFAAGLIAAAEGQEAQLVDRPGFHPLGALCFYLLELPATPRHSLEVLAALIERYELIEDPETMERVRGYSATVSNSMPWRVTRRRARSWQIQKSSLASPEEDLSSEASHLAWYMMEFLDERSLGYMVEDYFPEAWEHFPLSEDLSAKVISLVEFLARRQEISYLRGVLAVETERYKEFFEDKMEASLSISKRRNPRRVFVCYHDPNDELASGLVNGLTADGWDICVYPRNRRPGESRFDFYDRALSTSGVVALVITSSSQEEPTMQIVQNAAFELATTPQASVRIVVVPVDDSRLRPMMYAFEQCPIDTKRNMLHRSVRAFSRQLSS